MDRKHFERAFGGFEETATFSLQYSEDNGRTWQTVGFIGLTAAIEHAHNQGPQTPQWRMRYVHQHTNAIVNVASMRTGRTA